MLKTLKHSAFFLFLGARLFAQLETSNWYFGHFAGLNFSTAPPTILTDSAMNTIKGCSSISDSNGNLLFYTNGATIWDKTHQVMANGTGLWGNVFFAQPAIIIQKPGSVSLYYVFTIAYYNMAYSIVDMSLASGNGSVTVKNVSLPQTWTYGEKLTAARHCNGQDVWVIARGFSAYRVSSAGIDTNAVHSAAGNLPYLLPDGCMKASPNSRKIACAGYSGGFELFDFDNSTGIVSHALTLIGSYNHEKFYGCEFSPDGTKVYTAGFNPNVVYQWDLCAGSDSAIVASQYTMAVSPSTTQLMSFQLGLDGKIYIARAHTKFLATINNPNAAGSNCNYVDLGQSVAPNKCYIGLPNFLTSFFEKKPSVPSFTYDISTSCSTASFNLPSALTCPSSGYTLSSLSWSFGDPASGSANTSTLLAPIHNFSQSGSYTVSLIVNYNCSSDTNIQVITVGPDLQLNAFPSPFLCPDETVTISVSGADYYLWNNNSTAPQIVVSPTTTCSYSVVGTTASANCSSNDAILITVMECTDLDNFDRIDDVIEVFPNPSSGAISIDTRIATNLCIYNPMGKLILGPKPINGYHNIDLQKFPPAVYNFVFQTNQRVYTLKVIKVE